MIVTKDMIVVEARSYLGTPYHHIGRKKGIGVDCIGLIAGVAQHFGLTFHDIPAYPKYPDGETLVREFSKCLEPIPIEEAGCGDVLVFWIRRPTMPTHAAIRSPVGLIHTHSSVGKVVEHGLDEWWRKRIHKAFRYPKLNVEVPEVQIEETDLLDPSTKLRMANTRSCCGD